MMVLRRITRIDADQRQGIAKDRSHIRHALIRVIRDIREIRGRRPALQPTPVQSGASPGPCSLDAFLLLSFQDQLRVYPHVEPAHSPVQVRRSEEHTSELQSRENIVCRLLLEKTNIV